METQGAQAEEGRGSSLDRSDRRIAVWLWVLLFCVYALSSGGHMYSTDEEAMYAVTRALARTGEPFVRIDDGTDGHVRPAVTVGRDGRLAVFASWGQSISGLPLYVVGSAVAAPLEGSDKQIVRRIFTGWTGSAATAAGAAIFFLIARILGARKKAAVILTLGYGLTTFAWPHAKTFFSEPITTALLLASWYLALRENGRRRIFLSGMLAGATLLWRTTTIVMLPPIAIWLLIQAKRRDDGSTDLGPRLFKTATLFGLGFAIPVALLALSNWWRFGNAASFGYPAPSFALEGLGEGLYGLFLSPGKGLFLFAPIALAGVAAIARVRHHRTQIWLMFISAMTSAILFAAYVDWHGDHAWGPRYLVMSLPFFLLPLAQFMDARAWRRAVLGLGLGGFAISSLGVIINFNSYFIRAAEELPRGYQEGTDDLLYWRYTHFDPYWSQVAGHARLLPFTLKSTVLDLMEPRMGPFPETPDEIFDWYLAAPLEADSWVVWLRQARGPMWLASIAPLFAAGAVFAYRKTWRSVREQG